MEKIAEHLAAAQRTIERIDVPSIELAINVLSSCWRKAQYLFLAGNGGSFATAMHAANDIHALNARNSTASPVMPVCLPLDNATATATANDFGYDQVFSRFLGSYGMSTDALMVFSVSGTSPNITKAVDEARLKAMPVIGFFGSITTNTSQKCTVSIHVPSMDPGTVEAAHVLLVHTVVRGIEESL